MTLQIVPPVLVDNTTLTSTTIAEPDASVGEVVWNIGTPYALGDRVILVSTHRVYESLEAGNTGNDPATTPTKWLDVGPTNRYAMFDTSNSTKTTSTTDIVVEITPGYAVNCVALLTTRASKVKVEVIDPVEGTVYTKEIEMLSTSGINNWWMYFFTPIGYTDTALFTDLPSYGSAKVKITVYTVDGSADVGTCLLGATKFVGNGINVGAKVGIQDYSRKEIDQFGNFIVVQRNFAKRATFDMAVENTQIDELQNLMAELRTTPCLWIGLEQYKCTVVYGFYKDFDIVIAYHTLSDVSIEIEGLT